MQRRLQTLAYCCVLVQVGSSIIYTRISSSDIHVQIETTMVVLELPFRTYRVYQRSLIHVYYKTRNQKMRR